MNSHSSSDRHPVEALAEEYLERFRRGQQPAISEFVRRHPELADEIRDLFPLLVVMEDARPPEPGLPLGPNASSPHPTQLGDFRIIREVGRGGMGVVYEAEQVSLGRRVALKLLPKQWTRDAKNALRFEREARAAAKLHHTNIVPVFGVGTQEGLHYFVMQFIHGQGLDEVLVELKRLRAASDNQAERKARSSTDDEGVPTLVTSPKSAEPICACAPTTTGAAHSLVSGQFERTRLMGDPASEPPAEGGASSAPSEREAPIAAPRDSEAGRRSESPVRSGEFSLPGPNEGRNKSHARQVYWHSVARIGTQAAQALQYAHEQGIVHRDIKPGNLLLDTGGTLWVTDFGLAKAADQQDLTQTGDLLGTLRYMAPEQFEGRADARSDVYSLGLTLYELLTLRPAFDESDRHKLIKQVVSGMPSPLRTLDPHIPRDLETIVHKAIDREPAQRYQAARELAEDLQRYERGEPILARPSPIWERIWRWCRRNPSLAALTAAVLLLLLTVAIGSTIAASVYLAQRNDLQTHKDEIERESTRAQQAERAEKIARRDAQTELAQSYLDQARANRLSRRIGQRYESLRLLSESVRLARELELPADFLDELRNETIASLALPDLRVAHHIDDEFRGDGAIIFDASFSRYMYWNNHGRISMHRVADHQELVRLPGSRYDGMCLLSADGRFIAAVENQQRRFQVWNVEGTVPVLCLDFASTGGVFGLSASSGQLAIRLADHSIAIYDLATGMEMKRIPSAGPAGVMFLAFHPQLPQLAVCLPDRVRIFDTRQGELLTELTQPATTHSASWHPQGTHLAVATVEDQRLHLWNISERKIVASLEGLPQGTTSNFDPTGDFLATAGWDHVTRLWHWRTGQLLLKTENPTGLVQFSSDGRYLGPCIQQKSIGYWEVETAPEHRLLVREMALGKGSYAEPEISPDGRLLLVEMVQGVGIWDLRDGRELGFLTDPSGSFQFLARDRNDMLFSGRQVGYRWPMRTDPQSPDLIKVGPPTPLTAAGGRVAASGDGDTMAVSQFDGALVVRRADPPTMLRLRPHDDCRYIAISPDGHWVATGSHYFSSVKIWNATNGQLVKELLTDHAWIRPVFSSDGRWLLTNQSNVHATRLWHVGTWDEGPPLGDGGFGSTFSPECRQLAVGTTRMVRLLDVETARELAQLQDPWEDRPEYCRFSPDGTRLVVVSEVGRRIHVWDLSLIGQRLQEIGLEWNWPDLPDPPESAPTPVRLQIDWGVIGAAQNLDRARRHLNAQKWSEALAEMEDAIKLTPESAEAWHLRGRARSGLKQYAAAIEDYTQALSIQADHVEALHNRGHAYEALKRYAEASHDFDAAVGLRSADVHLLEMAGWQHYQLRDYETAFAHWRRSLQAQPRQPAVEHLVARILLLGPETLRDAAQALEIMEALVQSDGKRHDYRNTLGIAYYRVNRLEEAIATLDQAAVALQAQNQLPASNCFFLALAWHKRGDRSKAHAFHEQGRKLVESRTALAPGEQGLLDLLQTEVHQLLASPN